LAIVAMVMILSAPSTALLAGAATQSVPVETAATPITASSPTPDDQESDTVRLPAAPALDEGSSGPNVRTRTDRQGSDTIPESDATPSPTEDNSVPRLDDPVLRWLPEIMAASDQWGVPPELIAAVMRVESQGVPGVISPAGARGLMQMMPGGFGALGIPEYLWHDPATNISTGANGLYWRMLAQGSWQGAVGAYLGFGCDIWGTCTDVYVRAVFGWADYFRPIIANPRESGFGILPKDWAFGPIVLFQLTAPPKLEEPPDTPTPTATGTTTATPKPGEPTATPQPGNQTPVPTESGDQVPTVEPTTAPPTEVAPTTIPPTEVVPTPIPPTEVPTAIPTIPPPPPAEVPTVPPPPDSSPGA
jgi:hypothetical protein